MALDHIASLEADVDRVVAAVQAGRDRPIPWSDTWTVQACGHHIGTVFRAFRFIIEGRPTRDFSAFGEVPRIDESDPALPAWLAEGGAELVEVLRRVDAAEPCWSWWPPDQSVGFWTRRATQETAVHRWDLELGAGLDPAPFAPAMAADGIDEYLEIFVGMARLVHGSPGAGESVHVHCTDTDGEWLLRLPAAGASELTREHAKGDVALRGPAQGLLLGLWGRLDLDAASIEVLGDAGVRARWDELFPPM